MAAKAIIRIGALPDGSLRRALEGTVDAARRASAQTQKDQERAAKATVAAQQKAAKQIEAARERSAKAVTAAERKAAKDQEREAQKLARAEVKWAEWSEMAKYRARQSESREAEKSARAQVKSAEKAAKEELRIASSGASNRRALLMTVGAGAYGTIKAGAALVAKGQGVAGVQSLEERLNKAGDFNIKMIRAGVEAKASKQQIADASKVLKKASVDFNQDILELADGLGTAQGRFDKFLAFAEMMPEIAKISQATGAPVGDLMGAIGTSIDAFGLEGRDQIAGAANAMISAAARGAINVQQFSTEFAPQMSLFKAKTGRGGEAGFREFLALSQMMGTAQTDPAVAANLVNRFLTSMSDKKTQDRLHHIGIDVTKGGIPGGELLNIGEIITRMHDSKEFSKSAALRQVTLPDSKFTGRAVEFLMGAIDKKGKDYFKNIEDEKGGAGSKQVNDTLAMLADEPMNKLRKVGLRAQVSTIDDEQRLVDAITPSVTALTELQSRFPLMTEGMGTLETAVREGVTALVALRLAGGVGGSMGGSIAQGVAAGSTGFIGKLGMVGAAVGAGVTAFEATTQLLAQFGGDKWLEKMGKSLYDAIHGTKTTSSGTRGTGISPKQQRLIDASQRSEIPWSYQYGEETLMSVPGSTGPMMSMPPPESLTSMTPEGWASRQSMLGDRQPVDLSPSTIAALSDSGEIRLSINIKGPGTLQSVATSGNAPTPNVSMDNGYSGGL